MQTLKTGFALITIILLTILGTEYLFRILFFIVDGGPAQTTTQQIDERALLPAYEGADYDPVALWQEIWDGTNVWLDYEPYTVWSRKPVSGHYVNVNDNGRRVTSGNSEAEDALVIWNFGGSTTWGMAVPDSHTIPSYLARHFNSAGVPTRVTNYGETGFVSTQDLLALVRALQGNVKPDVVIFYEGANEPLGLTDRPDLVNPHYLMDRIQALFEGTTRTEHPALVLLKNSAYYRLATAIGNRIGPVRETGQQATYPTELEQIPALAEISATAYRNNLQVISALANEYDFRPYFFFQPRLGVGVKTLDASEQTLLDELMAIPEQDWMIRFTNQLRTAIVGSMDRDANHGHFYDIADAFADMTEPVYVDWVHVSHKGNARLADEIFRTIRDDSCRADPEAETKRRIDPLKLLCGEMP